MATKHIRVPSNVSLPTSTNPSELLRAFLGSVGVLPNNKQDYTLDDIESVHIYPSWHDLKDSSVTIELDRDRGVVELRFRGVMDIPASAPPKTLTVRTRTHVTDLQKGGVVHTIGRSHDTKDAA